MHSPTALWRGPVEGLGADPGGAGDGGDHPQVPARRCNQPYLLHCHHLEEGLLAHIQLFLSTVSAEFKGYREMLRRNLNYMRV